MESLWQLKCSSTLPTSSTPSSSQEPRDQMETNMLSYSYPHVAPDLRSTVFGRMQDHFTTHKPGSVDLGNSFLALLSGSPSLLQCDFQELTCPKSSGSYGKLAINHSNVNVNSVGSDIPLISSGLQSEYLSNQNLQNGEDLCHIVSTRAVVNSSCSGNSALHDFQGSDLAKAVISSHIVPGNEKVKVPYSLSGEWHHTIPAKLSSMNIQCSQKLPLEADSSISMQSSSFMSGCPRVFCSGTSGHLLLSNTGLLGIVCSCHCFHMSVSKFCEHSGLCDVNPGGAVHMDSGETIAQWRKLYFQKFEIRVPEDRSEWDWPEGLSVTAGFVKSCATMPNVCKSPDLPHPVGSSGGLVRSGQSLDHAFFPKNPHADQDFLIDASQNKKQRNVQDLDKFLPKGLNGTSWSNLHAIGDNQIMEFPTSRRSTLQKFVGSGLDSGCQSISAYNDFIMKNGNSSVSHSALQNVRDLGKDSNVNRTKNVKGSVIVGRDATSSSIELRLGQPYQPSQTLGNSVLPVIGPQLFDKLVNPPKSCFHQQIIDNAANYSDEDRRYHHHDADPFNSSAEKEPNQLNHGSHTFGISNSMDAARQEKLKGNVPKSSVALPCTDFHTPTKDSLHFKANVNMVNCTEHVMPRALNRESHAAECDPFNVYWNAGNGFERQLNISALGSQRFMDKGKGVGCVADVPYVATDIGYGNHKQVDNSILGGSSDPFFAAVNDKSCYSCQLTSIPPDVSDARNLVSYLEKFPCLGSSGQGDYVPLRSNLRSQGVSMGFPLVTSTSTLDGTPSFLRQDSIGVSPYLLDENLRLLALRQIMDLSKQQHALSSLMNQEQGKYGSSSNVQHSLVDPSTSQEQRHRPNLSSGRDVSEPSRNLLQSAATFRVGDEIEKVASVTGIDVHCQLSDDPSLNERPSLRLGRSDNNVSRSSEHEICFQRVPRNNCQGKCSCEVSPNNLGRNFDSQVGSSFNAFKEQMGTCSGEASIILNSKFAKDHFLLRDANISLERSGKLNGQLHRSRVCHASEWRDVPSKVKGVRNAIVVERLANVLDRRGNDGSQLKDASAKCFNGVVQIAGSLKEQENSNVSSGCSAPAVTQSSIEVNNIEFSTIDAGDTGYVSNDIVDEGSGIDKCWSSDDALGSERSADFLGSTCRTNLRKEGSSHVLNNQSSRSLLDELKLMDSLTWKKDQNQIHSWHQIHTGLAIYEKNKPSRKMESGLKSRKRKRAIKLKMLSASFPSAGHSVKPYQNPNSAELPSHSSKDIQLVIQSDQETSLVSGSRVIRPNSKRRFSSATTHSHKRGVREDDNQTESNGDADFCKNPEVSGRKKLRRCFTSGTFRKFRMQESTHEEAKETEKYNSVGCVETPSSRQLNLCSRKARLVVCGKYGEISNGKDALKPAKIVPLSRILKTARRCTLPKNCKPRLTSMRELRNANSTGIDLCCDKFTDLKNGSSVAICDKINLDNSAEETAKAWCSEDEQFAKSILVKENDDKREKDYIILHSNAPSQPKFKCKEIRKRSIYELTVKGNKYSSKSFPCSKMSKCIPEMKVGKILKNAEDGKRGLCKVYSNKSTQEHKCLPASRSAAFCCVCGSSNQDDINCLLECSRCLIRVHQACYGVSKVPKGRWYCRPCRTSSKDIVCVLCGYGGGAMTRALRSRTIVKSILKAWNCEADCRHKNMISSAESLQNEPTSLHSSGSGLDGNSFSVLQPENIKSSAISVTKMDLQRQLDFEQDSPCAINVKVHNSITVGVLDSTVKQWVHMVCGLWTPGTRCPNVETMSAFDVSGASCPRANVACSLCNRSGGSCVKCRVLTCSIQFHPWCAHQKGLLQSEVEGVDNESVGFYGRCVLHATYPTTESACDPINSEIGCHGEKEFACARTEGYKGRKRDDPQNNLYGPSKGKGGCLVPQEQLNAWIHINGQKTCTQGLPKLAISDIEHDCRKEYARYKQAKGWKHLVVYKSGIHALGLYTSRFISRGEMVVEYVGEIVGLRVADKRENEYQSGRKLQYKSACYFFRIDKEHIIDATRKGGIARFVNHSCLPNCVAKVISVRNEKKVVFFAERDIFPGEEITYDYHFNHEDEGKKIPCFCKSKNCRRFLN